MGKLNVQLEKISTTDATKPIRVTSAHPVFQITLESNPTTGYSWRLFEIDRTVMTPLKQIYHAPPTFIHVKGKKEFLAGAPGYEVWTFEVNHAAFAVPGISKMTLTYMRPWETGSGITKTFVVLWQ